MNKIKSISIFTTLFLSVLFIPFAHSEGIGGDLCHKEIKNSDVIGRYMFQIVSGTVTARGRTFPISPMVRLPVELVEVKPGKLDIVSSADGIIVVLEPVKNNKPWQFKKDIKFAPISSEDFELGLGCNINDLPRYTGFVTGRIMEGDIKLFITFQNKSRHISAYGVMEGKYTSAKLDGKFSVKLTPLEDYDFTENNTFTPSKGLKKTRRDNQRK